MVLKYATRICGHSLKPTKIIIFTEFYYNTFNNFDNLIHRHQIALFVENYPYAKSFRFKRTLWSSLSGSVRVLSKSESVKFLLIESVIWFFTDSSVKSYFTLLSQLIFTEVISEIWLIYSNVFLAIWISQILLIISRFWLF